MGIWFGFNSPLIKKKPKSLCSHPHNFTSSTPPLFTDKEFKESIIVGISVVVSKILKVNPGLVPS